MAQAVLQGRHSAQRRRLGELLVIRGVVTDDDVATALTEQRRTHRRIGQILLARGAVTHHDLERALAEQSAGGEREGGFGSGLLGALEHSYDRRHEAPGRVRAPLGELLVTRGAVKMQDVAAALAEQTQTGARLGEILVGRGAISLPEVAEALAEQQQGDPQIERGFGSGLRQRLGRGVS